MGQFKEVDEWLLGSGESAETAVSNTKNIGAGLVEQPKKPDPVKPKKPVETEDDEDTWMFRTFSKSKQQQVNVHIPHQEEENANLDEFMSNLESKNTIH